MSARDRIADVLSRVYDGRPLDWQSPEHAAHHTEAADRLLAAGLASRAAVLAEARTEVWGMVGPSIHGDTVAAVADELTKMIADAGKDSPRAESTRAEVLAEAADAIEQAQAREETEELDQFGQLDHETELIGEAVRIKAALLRRMAAEAGGSR